MRLKLSHRFSLYVAGILVAGVSALLYHQTRSSSRLLADTGLHEAERLSGALFDALYVSMMLGGGREDTRVIVERVKEREGILDLRVLHGPAIDRQYGVEADELPADELERSAIGNGPLGEIDWNDGEYGSVRFVNTIVFSDGCTGCHMARAGEVAGAVSVKLSLERYAKIVSWHNRNLLIWGAGVLVFSSLAVFATVKRRLIAPIERLKDGAAAFAGGDLGHRVRLTTGDEIEDLGISFDAMAESLLRAASRLNELSERHAKVIDMAADAIVLIDLGTGSFVEVNGAASALTGYSREELLGMRPEALYPLDRVEGYRGVFRRWEYDGSGYLHEAEISRKGGGSAVVEISASVLDIGGRRYLQEIWRDLSERKGFGDTLRRHVAELEEAVRSRTSELDRTLKEREAAFSMLKDSEQRLIQSAKLISLGEMGAGIAHELNSPIAGVLSIAEVLLKRAGPGAPDYGLLLKIKDAAVRSKYIILDMLTYARPSRGSYAPMYLNESLRATLCLFMSEIKTGSIEIVEDFDPALPKVYGNMGQVIEVMLNIIKNARDALSAHGGEHPGKIFISTRVMTVEGARYSVAEIRDNGPGVPDGIKDKIFDPFFTTKEKGGGLNIGLGLSISRSIIKEHGGFIELESASGNGAAFRVYMPVYEGKEVGSDGDGSEEVGAGG
jgi:PAS domain S-box-containing protein